MHVVGTGREATTSFNQELSRRMHAAEEAALLAVGRTKKTL